MYYYLTHLASLTNDFNGQYILLSASPNDAVWSASATSFGTVSANFLKGRAGTALAQNWFKKIDEAQESKSRFMFLSKISW